MKTIVSKEAWRDARVALLEKEKAFTREREALAAARRGLPWTRVETPYAFEGREGRRTFADLFEGRSQLLVYHLMFAPEWEAACKSCSFWADGFDATIPHLAARDVTFAAISRAPVPKLEAFAKRLGWTFPWYSSGATSFNYDFNVSFDKARTAEGLNTYNYAKLTMGSTDMPGFSAFARDDEGGIFHTYSCFARGIDMMNPTYQMLDLVAKGRDEAGLPYTMSWLSHRDAYGR
jgi:predicted dithiol-disulfide oxidoreductase (DUF899 family)